MTQEKQVDTFAIGYYSVNLSEAVGPQHSAKLNKILTTNTMLAAGITQMLLRNPDLVTVTLRVTRDDLWPSQGGFNRSDRYGVFLETDIE